MLFNLQVGLLNVDGYYNSLLSFIDKAVDEGFITPAARHIIVSAQTAQELMSKLEVQHQPSLSIFPYILYIFLNYEKNLQLLRFMTLVGNRLFLLGIKLETLLLSNQHSN